MIDKDNRFVVTYSVCQSFKVGDVVKPIKLTKIGWLIGHNYRQALYFEEVDGVRMKCESMINPGIDLVWLERIK